MLIIKVNRQDWLHPEFTPRPGIAFLVKCWNETFKIKWQEYRYHLQQIADECRSQITGDVEERDPQPGELVLPIDDDDWLNPLTAEVLNKEAIPGLDVRLTARKIANDGCFEPRVGWLIYMGQFAVWYHEDKADWLRNHVFADPGFRNKTKFLQINAPLAVWNSTIGSDSVLMERVIRPEKLPNFKSQYIRQYKNTIRETPKGWEWCVPYLRQVLELTEEL